MVNLALHSSLTSVIIALQNTMSTTWATAQYYVHRWWLFCVLYTKSWGIPFTRSKQL